MKITVVGPRWRARWTDSVQRALSELGHTATVLEYHEPTLIRTAPSRLPRWVRRSALYILRAPLSRLRRPRYDAFNQEVIAHVRDARPDLVLLLRAEVISSETVRAIKQQSHARVAMWWIDDPFRFPSAIAAGRACDSFFVFCPHCLPRLREAGIPDARYLPCAFDPLIYRPMPLSAADRASMGSSISFVGAYYPRRGDVLEAIADLAPAIWGPGWRTARARGEVHLPPEAIRGDDVEPETMARLLNASAISLNIHHPQSRLGGLNMRAFEAAACGAFQLVDAIPATGDLFQPGDEMVFYQDTTDLRRLLTYYLAHPDEAAAIAARARDRAMREHTFRQRMATLLAAMEG